MRAGLALGIVVGAVALAGCTGAGNFNGPGGAASWSGMGGCGGGQQAGQQYGVCNQQDSFSYGFQGSKQGSESWAWQNGGSRAQVSWGVQASGAATLTIKDASGSLVFTKTFAGGQASVHDTTGSGAPGGWTITLSFTAFSGQSGLFVGRA